MKFELLREKIEQAPIFSFNDILKWFPKTKTPVLKVQISQWLKNKNIIRLKNGLYYYTKIDLTDPFFICPKLYFPSYISLETALNYYGLIPDVPQTITSITNLTTANFKTKLSNFSFHKIQAKYFFGWRTIKNQKNNLFYNIAQPEKAMIDFLYFNKVQLKTDEDLKALRFNFTPNFRWQKFIKISKVFSQPQLRKIALSLQKFYA
jgi:predicted transcriptional regulator of viral defense system